MSPWWPSMELQLGTLSIWRLHAIGWNLLPHNLQMNCSDSLSFCTEWPARSFGVTVPLFLKSFAGERKWSSLFDLSHPIQALLDCLWWTVMHVRLLWCGNWVGCLPLVAKWRLSCLRCHRTTCKRKMSSKSSYSVSILLVRIWYYDYIWGCNFITHYGLSLWALVKLLSGEWHRTALVIVSIGSDHAWCHQDIRVE